MEIEDTENLDPQEELKRMHALYATFSQNAIGSQVLEDLKKRFHYHSTTVRTDVIDVNELAYAEGQRSVVLFLIQMGEIGKLADK